VLGESNDLGSAIKTAKVVPVVVANGMILAGRRIAASKAPQWLFTIADVATELVRLRY
jgi:hypothetical protein